MWRMLQQDTPDDYVISTGVTHSIRDLLEVAFERVGITDWERLITQDPRFMRPAEVELLIGDSAKAKDVLGWEPKVGFTELVQMMVDNDLELQRAQKDK
jgi:GDPmannose 4,6-dehydratase